MKKIEYLIEQLLTAINDQVENDGDQNTGTHDLEIKFSEAIINCSSNELSQDQRNMTSIAKAMMEALEESN